MDFVVLEHGSSQAGARVRVHFHHCPAQHAPCDVCLLLLPLHVVSSCSPVWGPSMPTPLPTASVPGMAMLGLQKLACLALSFHLQQDSSDGDWES